MECQIGVARFLAAQGLDSGQPRRTVADFAAGYGAEYRWPPATPMVMKKTAPRE